MQKHNLDDAKTLVEALYCVAGGDDETHAPEALKGEKYIPQYIKFAHVAIEEACARAFQTGYDSGVEYKQEQQPVAPEPDWSTAPEWAHWWAVDCQSVGKWYEIAPYWLTGKWNNHTGRIVWDGKEEDLPLGKDWRETLTERPQEEQPCNQ